MNKRSLKSTAAPSDSEMQQQAKLEAHRLIGSLGTFGLPQGSEVAREMEKLLQAESLGQDQSSNLRNCWNS
ncbi:MAG: Hpt domain-containing protein [Potamolinea sp.]